MPTSRGLSQAPTSFFGSWCQGIHRVPLVTWHYDDARVHCAVLKIRAVPAPLPPRSSTFTAGEVPRHSGEAVQRGAGPGRVATAGSSPTAARLALYDQSVLRRITRTVPVRITVPSEPSGTVPASAPSAHTAARPVRSQACARSLRAQQRARPRSATCRRSACRGRCTRRDAHVIQTE